MVEKWLKISGLLCMFGLVREIRPSEPYITEYLLGDWRNITQNQVNREVYPIGTYSYLAQSVIVFLITDFLRYKPLIVLMGITGIIIWSMLIWTTSLLALQILEVFYGTYMAAEIAYYTYAYAKLDKKYYARVTSHTRAAMFLGKLLAGISSQLLLYFKLMDYKELNYITLTTQIIATVVALTLPKVKKSLYFHRNELDEDTDVTFAQITYGCNNDSTTTHYKSTISPIFLLWVHFRNAYTNTKVVQWSIWYAVGLCGYLQVYSYIQVLWKDIEPEPLISWNGAVDAILTALAAVSALSAGYLHGGKLKPRSSLLLISALTALEGCAVLMCCWTTNIYVSYSGFILFGGLYAFTITVSSAEVARYLEEDSYGLVFGINTLLALIMQAILTLAVVTESGWALSAVGQYTVYAYYFIAAGAIFFIAVIIELIIHRNAESSYNIT